LPYRFRLEIKPECLAVQYQQLRFANMNKFFYLLAVMCLAVPVMAQDSGAKAQPSLADLARKTRSQQKQAAIARYDEESFKSSQPSAPPETTADADNPEGAEKKPADAKAAEAKAGDEKSKDKPKADDWKDKIDAQKNEISMLQREIDVAQREQRMRAAAFYADAGSQLRDSAKFADDSRKQQEDIDSKKQSLDAAQQKLADLEEQARKAGTKTE